MSSMNRLAVPGLLGVLALLSNQAIAAEDATRSADAEVHTLPPIIVTAQKRSEDIQEVPMSISVIDADQLDNLHATQLSDYASYLPGFTVVNGGTPGQAMLGIRGIAPLSAGATVATYIDETPLGSSGNYGGGATNVLDLLPYDLQSLEVLRGPQGTLYGASALGGVIRYVTKPPDLDTASWRVGADTFSENSASDLGYGGRFAFNAPIVPGQLALSATIGRQQSPGYTDNVQTGKKDQDNFWQQAARATLLWKASEDVSVKLSALQSKTDAASASATALDPITLKPIYGDLKNNNSFLEPYIADVDYYNATVNWNLGWADFVSSTNYEQNKTYIAQDLSLVYGVAFPAFGLPAPGLSLATYGLKLDKTTQEFRLTSKNDDHIEWLVGVFYTNENAKQNQAASAQNLDYTPIAGLDPLAVIALPSTYKEYAAFGDLTYKFTSMFDVTGGVRWAHNAQNFEQISSGALVGGASDTLGTSSEDVFTYSLSPRLHFGPDSMAYLRIASGYQPGGPNIALPGVPPSVDASTLTNYEVGWKTLFDDHRLMFDVAVYDIEWNKIQVSVFNGLSYLANGGTARSRGVEFSAQYLPVASLSLGLNGAYTDAVLTEDVPSLGGLDGDRLPNVPKSSLSATVDYSFPLRGAWTGHVGGGLRYVGNSLSALAHAPNPLPQNSYTAIDLNASASNDHWTLRLFVKNLTDKRVYTNLTALPDAATGIVEQVRAVPLQPRTFGIGFDAKF